MQKERQGSRASPLLLGACTVAWSAVLLLLARTGSDSLAQLASNVGLTLIAFVAGMAGVIRGRRAPRAVSRFWLLLGLASLSWSAGQAVWTWYESVLGREVPFPSLADLGYLGLPPLAVAALFALPLASTTLAGRVRSVLDGLIVALSLLLVSWVVVLAPVLRAGGDDLLAQAISLAYPAGDTVVITIVIFTWLRARHSGTRLPISLPLVAGGLCAFAVADSGFVYLTTSGSYSSGSYIDIGWFLGFALLAFAAGRPSTAVAQEDDDTKVTDQLGTFLPSSAVLIAVATSVFEFLRSGTADPFVAWNRSALIIFLVVRQILTLRENQALTRHLEHRVRVRTHELQASRERFEALVQHSSDVVTVVDPDGVIAYQSASSKRVLGRPASEMDGTTLWSYMAADQAKVLQESFDAVSVEPLRLQTLHNIWLRADGSECHLELTVTNLLDDENVGGLILNSRDVTDRTALEDQLLHQAFHDSLTGLFNRAMFKERLDHALTRRRDLGSLAVLFLDLDGFKEVNDTLGHNSGDKLLVDVAARLQNLLRPSDTVARFGGDEFAILVEDLQETSYVVGLAERIDAVLREPYELGEQIVHLSASVGIAHDSEVAVDSEQLLRNADLAMYQAKGGRAGGYAIYDPSMHEGLVERVRLEGDLRRALEEGGLSVHYQPLINMSTGVVSGVEALARWNHPERGAITPGEFIPLAESTGLIRPLGVWILRTACRQTVEWQRSGAGLEGLHVSVNLSPRQLDDTGLAGVVAEVLEETGLLPGALTLEMTESVLMSDSESVIDTLTRLREMGVRLAIDDFGTGYSSLSYLHRFPIDVLKIDRSFIEQLSLGGDSTLVSTIVRLGHTMNLETVAEGIERPDEMLLLRRQGCTTGQGYHFSPPLPPAELLTLLKDRAPLSPDSAGGVPATSIRQN